MEPSSLHSGTVIDRFEVVSPLGEGGMAAVFRVRHLELGTLHALKVLTVGNKQIRDRLKAEGRIQARLRHPNIVTVTDILDLGAGNPGLLMELVEGPSLDQLLREHPLTLPQADELARGICAGVAAAHRADLVHRDLKPANILLQVTDQGFVPKVADFGLAKALSAEDSGYGRTRTGSTMGTPHYMAPEQIRDAKSVGPSADIFALGAILYEMVTGKRAFAGSDLLEIFNAVATGRYTPPRELRPDLPDRMDRAIRGALQIDPALRPASVDALAALWAGDLSPSAPSAFDASTLGLARSFSSSNEKAAPENRTWGAEGTIADADPTPPGLSTPSVPSVPLSSLDPATRSTSDSLVRGSAVAAVGLGGGMLLLGLAAVLVALVAGGAAVWWASSSPTAPISVPVAETPVLPVVAPTAIAPEAAQPPEPALIPEVPRPGPVAPIGAAPPLPVAPVVADPVPAEATPVGPVEPPPVDPQDERPIEDPALPAPKRPDDITTRFGPLLGSQDPAERRQGIANLAKRRPDAEADRQLVWLVRHDLDSTVKRAAWDVVRERWNARCCEHDVLQEAIVYQMGRAERDAIEALAVYGTYGEEPKLLSRGLEHPSVSVRSEALDALSAVHRRYPEKPGYAALVEPLTRDADKAVQRKANMLMADL